MNRMMTRVGYGAAIDAWMGESTARGRMETGAREAADRLRKLAGRLERRGEDVAAGTIREEAARIEDIAGYLAASPMMPRAVDYDHYRRTPMCQGIEPEPADWEMPGDWEMPADWDSPEWDRDRWEMGPELTPQEEDGNRGAEIETPELAPIDA